VVIGGWRGPGWRVFPAEPSLCRQVRAWIRQVIAISPTAADPDDAALLVSELFENAILHGPGGAVLVGYCLWPQGARIVVGDAGGRSEPCLRENTGSWQEGGRGLRLVDEISARWGTFAFGRARVVWCDLACPLIAASTDAWAWLPGILAQVSLAPPPADGAVATAGLLARPPVGAL
jgi:anti-sigma regulatory factor (Ser/Thr protein kinase)